MTKNQQQSKLCEQIAKNTELLQELESGLKSGLVKIYYPEITNHAASGKPVITVVLLKDPTTEKLYRGISICSEHDNPDKQVGRLLAFARARSVQQHPSHKPRVWHYLPEYVNKLITSYLKYPNLVFLTDCAIPGICKAGEVSTLTELEHRLLAPKSTKESINE